MAQQHGSDGNVLIDPAGGSTYVAVELDSWTLDLTRDREETTPFQAANKRYVQGKPDIKGTIGGVWNSATTPTQIFDIAMGSAAVGLKLVPSTLTPTIFFSGLGYIDASINVNSKGAIKVTGTFVGAGDWTLAP